MSDGFRVALVGSPNSGKTTVFNALTGLRSKVANYAGVTVDCAYGAMRGTDGQPIELIDLPGTYSLSALSPDERIALDYLHGRLADEAAPDAVLFVADSTSLARSLPLLGAVLRLSIPTVVALTMVDEIEARRGQVDVAALRRLLGVPVVAVVGNRGAGIHELRRELARRRGLPRPRPSEEIPADPAERFAWADRLLHQSYRSPSSGTPITDALDRWLLHPVTGIATFAVVMVFFFQAIFSWAVPLQDGLDSLVAALAGVVRQGLPAGLLRQALVDGVLTGVGSVIVFVPQIALLFLLLTFFEQVGYMSRAVFVIDRVMSWLGLDGRSFVALLSSYACAIPGIMAARSIPDFRQRLTTILVAPFMTCAARLPVYTLLIAAFVPSRTFLGFLNLQGLVMLGLYLLGALTALTAATVLRRGPLAGNSMPFYVELPPYRWPTAKVLWMGVWFPVRRFLKRAGTVILAASLILWVLLNFPATPVPTGPSGSLQTPSIDSSFGAGLGKALEPVFAPIGFDWKVTVGLIGSLAAREVIVSTLAMVYAVEDDEDAMSDAMRTRLGPPGVESPSFAQRLAVALSLLVFFVFALQCVSTLAVMRRETGSWRYPAIAFGGMFVLAYAASFVTFHLTLLLA